MGFLLSLLWYYSLPVVLAAAIYWIVKTWLERRNQPNGPFGFPVVGYLPFMDMKTRQHELFAELAKKYGDIFQITMGQIRTVVLNNADDVREVFKNSDFAYRPTSVVFDIIKEVGERNIIFANGERWRFCRKLANRGFSIFTTAKNNKMEPNLYITAGWFCKQMEAKAAARESIKTKDTLITCTGAMISSSIFGSSPDPDHPFMKRLVELMFAFVQMFDGLMMVLLFPQLEWFYRGILGKTRERMEEFAGHVRGEMNAHQYDGTVRTIADSMLKAVEEVDPKDKTNAGVTDDDIRDCVIDLFDAGFFTMSENLDWIFVLLAMHPEVQTKLQTELDNQMTSPGKPTILNDYNKLAYVRACVTEALRFATSQPTGVEHYCIQDTEYKGMVFPKGSNIAANLYAINHDPELFENPDKFIPERFVGPDGTFNSELAEKVLTFSVGKRRCPGEQFAKHQLFLFTAFVMARMSVRLDLLSFKENPILGAPASFSHRPGDCKLYFDVRRVMDMEDSD